MSYEIGTSADYIKLVLHASPFADNVAGIPQMCDLIRALAAERDALAAENARLREAVIRAKDWHLGDKYRCYDEETSERKAWLLHRDRLDAALGDTP